MTTQVDPTGLFARLFGRLKRSGAKADTSSLEKCWNCNYPLSYVVRSQEGWWRFRCPVCMSEVENPDVVATRKLAQRNVADREVSDV